MNQEGKVIEEYARKNNGARDTRRYQIGKLLGKGAFASVYSATCMNSGKTLAVKVVSKDSLSKPKAKQKIFNEISIHKALYHRHIVQLFHSFEDSANIYILLELCSSGTINDLLKNRKKLTEPEVKCLLHQIASGLLYIHSSRVIHRDIKPGNIFLNEKMIVKIGDFGLSTRLGHETELKRSVCGTPNYMAPEVLYGSAGHSYAADTWSLGVLAYVLLVGRAPFHSQNVKTTYQLIRANAFVFPPSTESSEECRDFIRNALVSDPNSRQSLSELLNHSFFTQAPFPVKFPYSQLHSHCQDHEVLSTERLRPRLSEQPRLGAPKIETASSTTIRRKSFAVLSRLYLGENEFPGVWAQKWVDYSSKYGLAYLLSNHSVGMLFNDSTKIVTEPSGQRVLYVRGKREEKTVYLIEDHPSSLHKKVNLLMHFKKQLLTNDLISRITQFVYIKKWVRTSYGNIFWMSDSTIQAQFIDKTEIAARRDTEEIAFVKRNKETTVCLQAQRSPEAIKRLQYAKGALDLT